MNYTTRRLIDGFKIDPKYAGKKFIAINSKKYANLQLTETLTVTVKETGEKYLLTPKVKPVKKIKFKDRYGRGDYWLLYFIAKPELKELVLF